MARRSRKRNRNQAKPSAINADAASAQTQLQPAQSQPEPIETANESSVNESPSEPALELTAEITPGITSGHTPAADPVIEAIGANTALIQHLIDQVNGFQSQLHPEPSTPAQDFSSDADEVATLRAGLQQAGDQILELKHRNEELIARNDGLLSEFHQAQQRIEHVEHLEQQIESLSRELTESSVKRTINSATDGGADAMSWEQRKQLILQQMEQDSFDAEEFVEDLQAQTAESERLADQQDEDGFDAPQSSPIEFVTQLLDRLQACKKELADRQSEVGELQEILQQQSETREGGVAIGAAAIAQMIDADELVVQERERLQQLQDQWEEKFRQSEIEASLERAKLSRERQEVAKKNEQLEEQLAHFKREAKQTEEAGGKSSRRWLAKLGLADDA